MTEHPSDSIATHRTRVASAISSWRSPDGAVITIRPTRPSDANMVQRFVRELSPQAKHFRFMGGVRELTPQMLRRFVRIDPACEVALVALSLRGGRSRQVGECRYAVSPGGDNCEFALAVMDAWQRRGLGKRLLLELISIARIRGLRSMGGDVLASNAAMLGLALKLGFDMSACSEDWSMRRVSLPLWPVPHKTSDSEPDGAATPRLARPGRFGPLASFTA